MARIYQQAYFKDKIIHIEDARLSIASSAVLYGLSVYTVFPVLITERGPAAFRLKDHFERLVNSARIIGIDTFERTWKFEKFEEAVRDLIKENNPRETVFARATVHVNELVAGTKSRGLSTVLSIFLYEAKSIIPQDGARLKVSPWKRVPDTSIPSRAKVSGAYVNSVLAKQDAIDSGYDDCVFLNENGHVAELSAANIFIVRDGVLITPDITSDILEGINRKTILEMAKEMNIPTQERAIDLTELYIADEVFACGTSAFVAFVKEIDKREIGKGYIGPITYRLKEKYAQMMKGTDAGYSKYISYL